MTTGTPGREACRPPVRAWNGHRDPSPGSMLRVAVAPCAPFTVTRELMAESARLARAKGVRLHTHLAETEDEERYTTERFGMSPAEYLDSVGWLAPMCGSPTASTCTTPTSDGSPGAAYRRRVPVRPEYNVQGVP